MRGLLLYYRSDKMLSGNQTMNIKSLSEMINGDFGKVMKIRGKAGIHRYLLELGIAVNRIVQVISVDFDSKYRPVTVRIGKYIHLLNHDIASMIKVEIGN